MFSEYCADKLGQTCHREQNCEDLVMLRQMELAVGVLSYVSFLWFFTYRRA